MPDETMIARVARALAPLAWAALETGDTRLHKTQRAASLRRARDAIGAMREPCSQMRMAGGLAFEDASFEQQKLVFDAAADAWRAMIDKALSEPEGPSHDSP